MGIGGADRAEQIRVSNTLGHPVELTRGFHRQMGDVGHPAKREDQTAAYALIGQIVDGVERRQIPIERLPGAVDPQPGDHRGGMPI